MKKRSNNMHFLQKLRWMLILLSFGAAGAIAQVTVNGSVTDANGNSLIGVNILIKGTNNGTITDVNGEYSIRVPDAQSILVFTYIGYKPSEVLVSSNTIIDVVLEEDMQQIEEMVVIAYGTQRKSHLTGAVSSLKNEKL